MYYFANAKNHTISAHHKLSDAARAALASHGQTCPPGGDPVRMANAILGDSGALLNLSAAFESIAESDDQAAQELARQFQQATDKLFTK